MKTGFGRGPNFQTYEHGEFEYCHEMNILRLFSWLEIQVTGSYPGQICVARFALYFALVW